MDVRGIPSGSLVYDPQDPNKDKLIYQLEFQRQGAAGWLPR